MDGLPKQMCVTASDGLGFMAQHVDGNRYSIVYGYKGPLPIPVRAYKQNDHGSLPEYYFTYKDWVFIPG